MNRAYTTEFRGQEVFVAVMIQLYGICAIVPPSTLASRCSRCGSYSTERSLDLFRMQTPTIGGIHIRLEMRKS